MRRWGVLIASLAVLQLLLLCAVAAPCQAGLLSCMLLWSIMVYANCLQALDRRIAEALDCPCVEDLKSGPCGELFVSTFTCYQKSRAEPKGCDCLDVSLAFAVSSQAVAAQLAVFVPL
jgi:hypothetical protein